MAQWIWMDATENWNVRGITDGVWSYLAIWLGDPPQLLHALASTSGTTLQVPFDNRCVGNGAFDENVSLPEYSRKDRGPMRWSYVDLQEDGASAGVWYIPQASRGWQSSSGCSRGIDNLGTYAWYRYPNLYDVWKTVETVKVPLERTDEIASIGLRAIATRWDGRQDYWWPLITRPMASLLQTLPFIQIGLATRTVGLRYTYFAGAAYRHHLAKLWLGEVDWYRTDADNGRRLTRPLSKEGALTLDNMTMELTTQNLSGRGNTSSYLISEPTEAVLDSTSSFLELPKDVCFRISEQLDLRYDEETGYFIIPDEVFFEDFRTARPSLRFGIGYQDRSDPGPGNPGPVEVELPFEALSHMHIPSKNLVQRAPIFPMRIAEEDRGIVLGRTFFQEIWLQVDYDKDQFFVLPDKSWLAVFPKWKNEPAGNEWQQSKEFWLPRVALAIVVLCGILFLPSLKITYNISERRHRRRRLERSWVLSHTQSIQSEDLDNYANAVIRKASQGIKSSKADTQRTSPAFWMIQPVFLAVSWLAHQMITFVAAVSDFVRRLALGRQTQGRIRLE